MNVSAFRFDVHDTGHVGKTARRDSHLYDSSRLLKVMPTYAYKNRRMTEKDLFREMEYTSKRWEDFRTENNGDRDEETIGSLHAEILACHGLVSLACYFDIGSCRMHGPFTPPLFHNCSRSWTNYRRQMLSVILFVDPLRLHLMSSTDFLAPSGPASRAEHAFSLSFMAIKSCLLAYLMMMDQAQMMTLPAAL